MALPTPPFMFRATSDESRGLNTIDEIDPLHGLTATYHPSISDIPLDQLSIMVYDHIRWRYVTPSEFSSWSASILFVIVHAVRKMRCFDEDKVLIYVMDVSKLKPINSVRSAGALIEDLKIKWAGTREQYTEGEYLIHGKLTNTDNLWQAVRLEQLVDAGLLTFLCPSLRDVSKEEGLYQRIMQLRRGDFSLQTHPSWITDWSYACIRRLAECFGEQWESIMTIVLIAIRRRDLTGKGTCMPYLRAQIDSGSLQLPKLDWQVVRILKIEWREHIVTKDVGRFRQHMPECKQYLEMFELLRQTQQPVQTALAARDADVQTNDPTRKRKFEGDDKENYKCS